MCQSLRNKSYVHGVDDNALLDLTIGECLEKAVRENPDGLALSAPWQNFRWSYRVLSEQVDTAAAALVGIGLSPGDRLGILAPNCAEWIVIQFAAARIGVILVNLNPAYRLSELEYALQKSGCRALITVGKHKSSNYLHMLDELASVEHTQTDSVNFPTLPDLQDVITIGEHFHAGQKYSDLLKSVNTGQRNKADEYAKHLQFDDVVNIQFTSGTTGSPKATALTHHNIVNNAWFVGRRMNLDPSDRICVPVPLYHCFGMVLGSLCAVTHQAATILTSPGFDAGKVLETIEGESCTALYGVPTMFIAELEHPDFEKFDLKTLRTGIMAGAPCPQSLMERVMRDMHLEELTIAYGMTETGPVSFQTSIDDDVKIRTTTVGQVLPFVEIKIVDDQGCIVPIGEDGELLTRGYSVMPYYWRDEQKTADAIDTAGWIASGDRATLDERGYCRIVGRKKDMLIRGGENIFPAEIEEFLYTYPGIEQVEVIGVADEKYGEQVGVWVKMRAGEVATAAQIVAFCKGKIAHFKIPTYVKFVKDFPITVTGKVQKFRMRELMYKEVAEDPDRYRVKRTKKIKKELEQAIETE